MEKTNKTNKIAKAVLTTTLIMGTASATTHALAATHKCPVEKCYGIAKKAKNDCGTSKHACAGQAKSNRDPNDWIFVMKGNCDRIVGGSLKKPG